MKKLLLILGILLFPHILLAQEPGTVITKPYPINNLDNQSSTIAVTNTFQLVFAAQANVSGRTACTIQNTGTNPMYVYFGATQSSVLAEATIAKSIKLIAGQAAQCNTDDIVIKNAVWITGTATETYYAAQQ
jgi:hypothetical protein